jgi:hypothetical protein
VSHTIKKDWVYLPLMLLPMPVVLGWLIVSEWRGDSEFTLLNHLSTYGPLIGISFIALAFGVVSFIRIRMRWLKIVVLFLSGIITLTLISFYTSGKLSFTSLLLLILLLVSIFLVPALLENGVRSGRWGKYFKHHPMI